MPALVLIYQQIYVKTIIIIILNTFKYNNFIINLGHIVEDMLFELVCLAILSHEYTDGGYGRNAPLPECPSRNAPTA